METWYIKAVANQGDSCLGGEEFYQETQSFSLVTCDSIQIVADFP